MAKGGLGSADAGAMDARNAQLAAVAGRLCERVVSGALLRFAVRPGTGRERRDRPFLKEASNGTRSNRAGSAAFLSSQSVASLFGGKLGVGA